MKKLCLFGDICPFDDCDQCDDYTPVDAYGEPDINLTQHKSMGIRDFILLERIRDE
ncbi:MAG: hypothetical protein J6S14_20880 [Clostridia bacterium]|nr:hypothetical protein [Clostridia bacterium]